MLPHGATLFLAKKRKEETFLKKFFACGGLRDGRSPPGSHP
jgi:hypothetical protein